MSLAAKIRSSNGSQKNGFLNVVSSLKESSAAAEDPVIAFDRIGQFAPEACADEAKQSRSIGSTGSFKNAVRRVQKDSIERKGTQLHKLVLDAVSKNEEDRAMESTTSTRSNIQPGKDGNVLSGLYSYNVYFKLLDSSWRLVWFLVALAYLAMFIIFGFLNWFFFGEDLDGSDIGIDSVAWNCICFAIENIVTMGWGNIAGTGKFVFFFGICQHLVGATLNVFAFTIVVTKFSHATAKISFARNCLVTRRDGELFLLIRIGNHRCNLIYHPEARVSFLEPVTTREGENFVHMAEIDVHLPGVISGVHTISHRIDENSPLHGKLDSRESLDTFWHCALSVVFLGRDGVYHDDLHAIKRYSTSDFVFDAFFACTHARDRKGRPCMDFNKFHDIIEVAPFAQSVANTEAQLKQLHDELEKPPFMKPGLNFFVGCLRLHEASPSQPLVRVCCFCTTIESMCTEQGIPFQTHFLDFERLPKWFKDHFPQTCEKDRFQTPAMLFIPDSTASLNSLAAAGSSTVFISGSDEIIDWLSVNFLGPVFALPQADRFQGGKSLVETIKKAFFHAAVSVPNTVADYRSPEKLADFANAMEALLVIFDEMEVALSRQARSEMVFFSGTEQPGREDFRFAPLLTNIWKLCDDIMAPALRSRRQVRLPLLTAWQQHVMARPSSLAAVAPQAVEEAARAKFYIYFAKNYMPSWKSTLPKRFIELHASLAPSHIRDISPHVHDADNVDWNLLSTEFCM